jgi:uncharacterized membrane protein HdeD (DUF308 family)
MSLLKRYGWTLFIVGASLLLALFVFLFFETGQSIVVPFVGAIILVSSVIRLVPYVRTQKNDLVKTVNIIEITIDVLIGLVFLLLPMLTEIELGVVFGWLLGLYLMMRGTVHFFGVSHWVEKSDFVLFVYHIATLIVGSYVAFSGFSEETLVLLIQAFSIIAAGYLGYGGFKGYQRYRIEKTMNVSIPKPEEIDLPTTTIPKDEIEEPVHDHVS